MYACEWNPNAIGALRHNLLVNGVQNHCIVLEGDNRLTAPKVHSCLCPLAKQCRAVEIYDGYFYDSHDIGRLVFGI